MPVLCLYEYFSSTIARDFVHTTFSRLIKIEALTKLNMFSEAICLLETIQKGDRVPYYLEDKSKNLTQKNKYVSKMFYLKVVHKNCALNVLFIEG
jgi:hypothetical protein